MYTNQQIFFRMIQCPDCQHLICWINSRLPNFCPECGEGINRRIKGDTMLTLYSTSDAWLRLPGRVDPQTEGRLDAVLDNKHKTAHNDASEVLASGNQKD